AAVAAAGVLVGSGLSTANHSPSLSLPQAPGSAPGETSGGGIGAGIGSQGTTGTTGGPVAGSGAAGTVANGEAGNTASGVSPGNTASAPSSPALPASVGNPAAKVEESGSITLTVGRGQLQPDLSRLMAVATANGGFAANTETQSATDAAGAPPSASITLQVPESSFATVLDQARHLGKVGSLSSKATDVTGQYVDLQARIAALEASRQQYLTIMSKATSIGDILAVQSQLDSLQSQLEELQGQLQVLDSQTTYATLAVSLTESQTNAPASRPQSGLAAAWHAAIGGFVAGFEGLVRIAGPTLFVVLCLGVLVGVGRFTWRALRRRTL
ncbi:MAG: DUF4349 domain-containing protein, partial [Acidimicrobiales bacterium]